MCALILKGVSIQSLLTHPIIDPVDLRVLLSYVLNKTHAALIAHSETLLTEEEAHHIAQCIARRQRGEPIAYIVGEREFFGLSFKMTPDVLIPRPETEHLVEYVLSILPQNARFLDLGTGSGAIAVAVSKNRKDCHVVATDCSLKALTVAKENAQTHDCSIVFYEGDWLDALPNQESFDVIASNPPYIAKDDPHLFMGDLRFEPSGALTDGHDGLGAFRAFIDQTPRYLKKGGTLVVEHGYDQGKSIQKLFTDAGFLEVTTCQDYAGIDRMTLGRIL